GDLRAGMGWDLIFIGINLYQIYRLVKDRLSLRLPEPDRELLRSVLTGLDDAQIARLLIAGELCEIARGTTLAKENQPLGKLFFICAGRVRVTIAGREVSHLEKGNFVGEVAFLTEKPATATVIAEGAVRALVFETGKLNQVFHDEAEVAGLIYQLLGRELCLQDEGQQQAAFYSKESKSLAQTAFLDVCIDVSRPRKPPTNCGRIL
ncbi:MAG: cyclic nucleotide-binding domain-containing protein, partial [Methyloceanibacter sp.]